MGDRSDRGAGSVEYLGVIVVAVLLVVAVLTAVSRADLGQTIACELRSIGSQSGTCGGPEVPTTYGGDQAQAPDQPGADSDTVKAAQGKLREALDGGFWGVRGGELDDAKKVIEGLNGAEIDAVVADMTDDELEAWVGQLEDGWVLGGWDREQRRLLWETFASKGSRSTLDRLATFTDELQPAFDEVGGDDARDEPQSPANAGKYAELDHDLVVDGLSPLDVAQGSIGDCWLVASMMAVVQADPAIIEKAITANANGSYTVQLYDDGKRVAVTVTPDMVLMDDGGPAFVSNGVEGDRYELWPLVLEKAVALHFGDFADIEGGTASVGLELLTGLPSTDSEPGEVSMKELAATLDGGGAIGLSSLSDTGKNPLYDAKAGASQLFAGHAYYVSDVDEKAGTVTVVNPWGIADNPPITLTVDQFEDSFRAVQTNEVSR